MKIAIVHDDFMQWGGAERVVAEMVRIWPEAPVYTSVYDPKVLPMDFDQNRLRPSFMQKIFGIKALYRQLFFLYPLAFESFDFSGFEVVISSTTRFAKSVITRPQTLHICYCNTPPRFLWLASEYLSAKKFNLLLKPLYSLFLPLLLSYLRLYDFTASQKVDFFIANSQNVARRIQKFYQRDSEVIYPFVDLSRFETPAKTLALGKYYLIVSRLGGHKRVDLAIEAFNQLGWSLKIIGEGPERKKYENLAKPNVEFLGHLPDREVVEYYQNCLAFIHPQEEDFGITALEAQVVGKPVVAFGAGGALETVVGGVTGEFFYPQTAEALIKTLRHIDLPKYEAQKCRENARRFSQQRFVEELKEFVQKKYEEHGDKIQNPNF